MNSRGSHPEVLLREAVLKICSKFTAEHPCRSVISIKLLCNVIEIALRHGCSSPVNLQHIFRTRFLKNTSWWLLLACGITNLMYSCFAVFICLLYHICLFWFSCISASQSVQFIANIQFVYSEINYFRFFQFP